MIKWAFRLVYIGGCIISQLLSGDLGKPVATSENWALQSKRNPLMMWFWFEAEGLEVAGHWCVLSTKTRIWESGQG